MQHDSQPSNDHSDTWENALQHQIDLIVASAKSTPPIDRVLVISETKSTQDICQIQANNTPGLLVVAQSQTAGRGQRGKLWLNDHSQGIAATFAIHNVDPWKLSIGAAVAVCHTIENLTTLSPKIRWQNDILINNAKIAGILIEVKNNIAYVGIGINIHQNAFPETLDQPATSLSLLGCDITRLSVLAKLIRNFSYIMSNPINPDTIIKEFSKRDCLTGTTQTFQYNNQIYRGTIESINPATNITLLQNDKTRINLPSAQTIRVQV